MPEHDEPASPSTALIPQPHGGALSPGGTPGNRGGRGRPKQRLVIAAGKDLATELKRLKEAAKPQKLTTTCPACQHTYTIANLVRGMDARTRIAYASLLAALHATDPDAGEPPTMIMVLTGTAADMVERATDAPAGIEYVDGTQLEPGQLATGPTNPAMGPPERTQSGSSRE